MRNGTFRESFFRISYITIVISLSIGLMAFMQYMTTI